MAGEMAQAWQGPDLDAVGGVWPQRVFWGTLIAVAAGLAWRLVRYLLAFPIWGDEAMVLADVLDRDYVSLTQTLSFVQVAPLGFLWGEKAVIGLLGTSEWAVRLLSLLAGSLGLVLFWPVCRRGMTPAHGALAVAILAASYFPVRHACEAKPYALDLLMSVGLLLGAVAWLGGRRARWLAFLAGWAPLAMAASYPAAFVGGGMSLALLPTLVRARWRDRGLYLLFNVAMVAAFAGHYYAVGRNQADVPAAHRTRELLRAYWQEAFPPSTLAATPLWLWHTHAGMLLAYPVGGGSDGSVVSLGLALVGAWHLWSARQRSLLLVCLLPFALTLVAAALHKYPYGGSARVAQHLAPMACILIAAGAARLLGFVQPAMARARWIGAGGLLLAALAAVGVGRDVGRPYKAVHESYVRTLVNAFWQRVGPGDLVVLGNPPQETPMVAEWYLRRAWPDMPRSAALAGSPAAGPSPAGRDVWLWIFGDNPVPAWAVPSVLGDWGQGLTIAAIETHVLPPDSPGDGSISATLVRLTAGP